MEFRQEPILNIEEIFNHNLFSIPSYQRSYSWNTAEAEDFWNDVLDVTRGNEDNHFFGQIVTFEDLNTKRQSIIDGQQRLITSVIFLSSIKNVATNLKNKINNEGVQYPLKKIIDNINEITKVNDKLTIILLQNSEVKQFFSYILNNYNENINKINNKNQPIKNMKSVYNRFNQNIYHFINDLTGNDYLEKAKTLESIGKSFTNKFALSTILTANSNDAFTIFETLNTRGKNLSPSDIIKSHLMSLIDKNSLSNFREKWNKMSNLLNDNDYKITKFIRSYWAAYKVLLPTRKLYRSINKEIYTKNDAINCINDLYNLMNIYNALNDKKYYQLFKDSTLIKLLSALRDMQVYIFYPLILAMYHKQFPLYNIKKVVYKIMSIYIRCHVICREPTNNLEKRFSTIANRIWNNRFNSIQDLINTLDFLNKDNIEVKESFNTLQIQGGKRGSRKWTLMYILSTLYNYIYNINSSMYNKTFRNSHYQLIKIDPYITLTIGNDINDYSNYIGNWTILENSLLKEYESSNLNKNKLIEVLNNSDVHENHNIANIVNEHEWTIQDIQDRQTDFSGNIFKIWK